MWCCFVWCCGDVVVVVVAVTLIDQNPRLSHHPACRSCLEFLRRPVPCWGVPRNLPSRLDNTRRLFDLRIGVVGQNVQGLESRVQDILCALLGQGSVFYVQGLGFRICDAGFIPSRCATLRPRIIRVRLRSICIPTFQSSHSKLGGC